MEVTKYTIKDVPRFIVILGVLIFTLFPVIWMITMSFKVPTDILTAPPTFIFEPTLENYVRAFQEARFYKYIINSLTVTILSTICVMIMGTPAAYSFARFNTGGGHLLFYIISTKMLPAIAIVIPYFMVFAHFRLLDTKLGLTIVYTMFNLPIAIWLLYGFFKDVPAEIEDAARIDGYTRFQTFIKVILPLVAPGLAVTATFCLMFAWNEFLFAFLLSRVNAGTITVGLSSFWTQQGVQWGPLAAAATISIMPMMIFTLALQKYLVRGLTFGAVKG